MFTRAAGYPDQTPVNVILGLAMVGIAVFWIYHNSVTRLTVSAGWDDVIEIGHQAARGFTKSVLVLRNTSRTIGIAQFGGTEPDSPLSQDLRQYAPRLFAGVKAEPGR